MAAVLLTLACTAPAIAAEDSGAHVGEVRLFAVPRLADVTQRRRSSDNPFGVLGPGDLVTSGRPRPVTSRRHPLSYWIFTGSHASAEAANARRRQQ